MWIQFRVKIERATGLAIRLRRLLRRLLASTSSYDFLGRLVSRMVVSVWVVYVTGETVLREEKRKGKRMYVTRFEEFVRNVI